MDEKRIMLWMQRISALVLIAAIIFICANELKRGELNQRYEQLIELRAETNLRFEHLVDQQEIFNKEINYELDELILRFQKFLDHLEGVNPRGP